MHPNFLILFVDSFFYFNVATNFFVMQNVTVEETKNKIESNHAFHLIDVREPHEHAEFNIGGTLLPLGKIQTMQIDDIDDWKQDEIIVYCRSGVRSMQAAMVLQQLGFAHVSNMTGGVLAWKEKFNN
jgi:rhodanese-related sulfurtransferase